MSSGDEWQELMSAWQSQPVDVPQLERSTRWKTYRMALTTASEVLLTLFVWFLLVRFWETFANQPLLRGWMLAWSVLTPLLGWWAFRLRRGLWRAADENVMTLLRLQLDRARGGMRMARFTICSCAFIAVVTGPWLATAHIGSRLPPGTPWHKAWGPELFMTAWLLAYIAGSLVYLRHQRREATGLERLLRELDATRSPLRN